MSTGLEVQFPTFRAKHRARPNDVWDVGQTGRRGKGFPPDSGEGLRHATGSDYAGRVRVSLSGKRDWECRGEGWVIGAGGCCRGPLGPRGTP